MSYIAVSPPTSIRDSASSASTTASDVPTPAAKARATRRLFVERHADSGVLVLAAHFPRAGYIVRRAGGFRFAPADAA